MQDRPTAAELLRAAQEFCERDLLPQLTGRVRFHARVLANVLAILEREWEHEDTALRSEWERLRRLLDEGADPPCSSAALREQVRGWNEQLARSIRSGQMDDRFAEVVAAVAETVREKLAIANPRWSP